MAYPVRKIPFNTRDWVDHKSLLRIRAFEANGGTKNRQMTIDYVVKGHAFSKKHTKSIRYDPGLRQPGLNVAGLVTIGPNAFKQDQAWLAGIVFHELVHSPQHAYYASKGVKNINAKRSEAERVMIALDEYEAYWWSQKRSTELGLSKDQQIEIRKRVQFAYIDIDDTKIQRLAKSQRFNAARDELIKRHKPKVAGVRTAMARRRACLCYA